MRVRQQGEMSPGDGWAALQQRDCATARRRTRNIRPETGSRRLIH